MTETPAPGRTKEEQERLNRRMIELLNELRVALPGVQILVGFLLIVPFSNGWKDVTRMQRDVYFATLLCACVAAALLIAPSALHRILFRMQEKEHIIETGTRQLIGGVAFLGLAMIGTILLITDVIFASDAMVIVATVFAAAVFGGLWVGLPLYRRSQCED
jgi:hypothetical protein